MQLKLHKASPRVADGSVMLLSCLLKILETSIFFSNDLLELALEDTQTSAVPSIRNSLLNKAIVDIRLRPQCRILTNSTKHCSCLMPNWYGTATWRTSKHNVFRESAHWSHGMKRWRHPSNRKYIIYRNAVRGGSSHGHRQHAQKFDEVRPRFFRVMRANRKTEAYVRTYRQTDR